MKRIRTHFIGFKILKKNHSVFSIFATCFYSTFSNFLINYSCCGPAKIGRYISQEPATFRQSLPFKQPQPFKQPLPVKQPESFDPEIYLKTNPPTGDKPFRDPIAADTEKVDREYLVEMCKSLIIQGHLPYVVMDDLE